MSKQDFYDRTLIRLRREYSKDEVIAAISKKLSEAEIENGKLQSEIDHLLSQLDLVDRQTRDALKKQESDINKVARIESRKEELYKLKTLECDNLRSRVKELTKQRDSLISKYYQLEKSINQ